MILLEKQQSYLLNCSRCTCWAMERVISCFQRRPDALSRLICFPWAGGGSIHYARWGNLLSSSVEGNPPNLCAYTVKVNADVTLYISHLILYTFKQCVCKMCSVLCSVCRQTPGQGESSQRAVLSEHGADCGWSYWWAFASTKREALCSLWSQVRYHLSYIWLRPVTLIQNNLVYMLDMNGSALV